MGKVCEAMRIDEARGRIGFGERWLDQGELLTLDGNTGRIYAGHARSTEVRPEALLARLAALRGRG